jgi:3-methyladenine DNA glycosylase/8-oxoguanine DNA glycosylase
VTVLSRDEVARLIVRRDKAFRDVVRHAGPPPARRNAHVEERFKFLVRSIVAQLLATSAANTIHARVIDACGGDVTVSSILATGPVNLKSAGLSRTKAEAMIDLAEHVQSGRIKIARHGYMDDHEITKEVTAVRGIGPWTAHMYLMHTMARRDVWPAGDYGVRNGWSIVHDLDEMISERDLALEGNRFAGVRSAVAWYCWQAVHFERAN